MTVLSRKIELKNKKNRDEQTNVNSSGLRGFTF